MDARATLAIVKQNKGRTAIIAAAVLFVLFVWPTLYRYDHLKGQDVLKRATDTLIRTNRFTGTTEELAPVGWREMKPG